MKPRHLLDGQLVTFDQAAKLTGLNRSMLAYRVNQKHMTMDDAVAMGSTRHTLNGQPTRLAEAAALTGISINTIASRMNKKGATLEQAIAFGPARRRAA